MDLQLDMSALIAKLNGCRTEVVTDGKKKALRAGGRVMRDAMRDRAPVLDSKTVGSTALEPGDLKAGMRSTIVGDAFEPYALVGPAAKVEQVARWVEYGHRMVKGGTSKVVANGKTRGSGVAGEVDVPAHPFLRPAYETSIQASLEAERESIAQTIQEQVR